MRARALGHRPGGIPARVAASKTAAESPFYYHGTRYRLRPGDVLTGGTTRSNQGYGQPSPHVFFSTDPQVARNFADDATGPDGKEDAKPRVYLVEPVGAVSVDPDEDRIFGSFYANSVRVVKEVPWATNLFYDDNYVPDRMATRKVAEADTAGVMVALIPEPEATRALMAASGSTEDFDQQHLTLLYLGSIEEAGGDGGRERLHRAVYDFAIHSGHDVLTGTANGWGGFYNPDEDGGVLVALWDIPGIAEFRAALKAACESHGVPMRTENHGFTPHQTMAYHDGPVISLPAPVNPAPTSRFTHVVISWGDDWQSVALESSLAPRTADFNPGEHPRGGHPENPGEFSSKPGGGTKTLPKPSAPKIGPAAPSAPAAAPEQAPAAKPADRPQVLEKMKARGDVYGSYLPKGKYEVGDPRNDPEFEARHNKTDALSDRYVKDNPEDRAKGIGGPTDELFDRRKDPVTGADNQWSPERRRVHEQILDRFVAHAAHVPQEGKCLILAGPSGAGKSTFLAQEGTKLGVQGGAHPSNYVVINPDDFKDEIPVDPKRYPGLGPEELAGIKHEESSYLAKQAVQRIMSRGYNVIMDVTLGNAAKAAQQYVEPYKDKYDYQVALVDGDMKNSLNNAGNRWKKPDLATGDRQWDGRFIPMSLVLGQSPTKPGFRSMNAEQFAQFAQNPSVKRAVVYDPYATDKGLQDAKAAIHEAIRRNAVLSSILRVKGGTDMSTGHQTTEITTKIRAYRLGSLSAADLVHYLTQEVRYKATATSPHERGSTEWYRWHEDGRPYVPGSFDEVRMAHNTGLLPTAIYHQVSDTLAERTQ